MATTVPAFPRITITMTREDGATRRIYNDALDTKCPRRGFRSRLWSQPTWGDGKLLKAVEFGGTTPKNTFGDQLRAAEREVKRLEAAGWTRA